MNNWFGAKSRAAARTGWACSELSVLYDIQTCLGLLGLMKEFYICGTLLLYYVLTNAISSQGQGLYVEPQAGTSFTKQTDQLGGWCCWGIWKSAISGYVFPIQGTTLWISSDPLVNGNSSFQVTKALWEWWQMTRSFTQIRFKSVKSLRFSPLLIFPTYPILAFPWTSMFWGWLLWADGWGVCGEALLAGPTAHISLDKYTACCNPEYWCTLHSGRRFEGSSWSALREGDR